MKVKEVIEELKKYNPEEKAMIQVAGDRIQIVGISPMFWDGVNGSAGCTPLISDGKKLEVTKFGGMCRNLRCKNDLSLKMAADAVGISPAYLSSIEFGKEDLKTNLMTRIWQFMCKSCNLTKDESDALYLAGSQQSQGIIEPYVRTPEEEKAIKEGQESFTLLKKKNEQQTNTQGAGASGEGQDFALRSLRQTWTQ